MSKTSRPAPAIGWLCRASRRSSWSTIEAREVLISTAVGFIRASSWALSSARVRSLSTRWMETTSASASSASLEGDRRAPAASARYGVRCWLQATTSMPKDSPMRATWELIVQRPSRPGWLRAGRCHGVLPRSAFSQSGGLGDQVARQAEDERQVSSTGGSVLLVVQHTVIHAVGRGEVDGGVAQAAGDQQSQARQALEQCGWEGGALAHDDHDVEGGQLVGHRILVGEVVGEHGELHRSPVGTSRRTGGRRPGSRR